jgi:predicted DNA-binding transcriptional regulator AlpA
MKSVSLAPVVGLDDRLSAALRDLEAVAGNVDAEAFANLSAGLERVRCIAQLRVVALSRPTAEIVPSVGPDRLLKADELAERLAVPLDWVYRHQRQLPFRVRVGSRLVRFSESGFQRWVRTREGKD